ncbi:TIMELESS-interacting protein [Sarotherodon galilaeus]
MSARLERGDRRRAVPQPSHEWLSFTGGPAIRDQPKIHSATVYRPSQTPHLPLSPERVTPSECRALDTRSESPLGARLPASPVGFPWSAPVLSQLLGASRGDPPGRPREGDPNGHRS